MKSFIVFLSTLLVTVFLTLPISCKKKKKDTDFNRAELLTFVGTTIILPNYSTLKNSSANLKQASIEFTNTPSLTTLETLQAAWKNASYSWACCEAINFGYEDLTMMGSNINAWPTNPTVIESEISAATTITEAYIAATGTTRKGFPAIEYLIFPTSGDNNDIVNNFTSATNFQRRKDYLVAITSDIATKSASCFAHWSPSGGNYLQTFISNTSIDAGSPTSLLLNAIIIQLEVIKNAKVGIPLGVISNGVVQPNLAEAPYSDHSLSLITANIETLEALYLGKMGSYDGIGFDDYLNFVNAQYENGQSLDAQIRLQFLHCKQKIAAINAPYKTSLTTGKASVQAAYLELKKLVVLLKLDMPSQLGIQVTFSDNDGD